MRRTACTLCILLFLQSIYSICARRSTYYGDYYVPLGRWPSKNDTPDYSTQLAALKTTSQQQYAEEPPTVIRRNAARRLLAHLSAKLPHRRKKQRHSLLQDDASMMLQENVVLCAATKKQKGTRRLARLGGRQQQEPPAQPDSSSRLLQAITQPIFSEEVWYSLEGDEFVQHSDRLDDLADMGEQLARRDESNEWIEWNANSGRASQVVEDGDILVWTGKSKREGYGSNVPWIKTRSTLPMTPEEMVDLLMDSDRVQTYNPWSLGRQDMYVNESGTTKIVKNKTQPPLGSKPMVAITLLHARPLTDGAWIVVSRAVGGRLYRTPEDDECGKSDILLGVNLLEPLDDNESSILTAVTHVYSSAIPLMLAERLGVKSAVKFVKDMRSLKVPA